MKFIVKVKADDLDKVLSAMLGLNIEIESLCYNSLSYIVVSTEKSKIDRLDDFCQKYMSDYNRRWGFPKLKERLERGEITQKKFEKEVEYMTNTINLQIVYPTDMGLTLEEKRDDKLKDLLN